MAKKYLCGNLNPEQPVVRTTYNDTSADLTATGNEMYLHGNFNQDTVRPNYGGSSSDSLIINVDNDKMIISGEVKWDGAIGEVANRAYPGDKGARNYAMIQELTTRIDEELLTAARNRDLVTATVSKLDKALTLLTTELHSLFETETNRAKEAEESLLKNLYIEVKRALDVENSLLLKLVAESEAREAMDSTLDANLTELIQKFNKLSDDIAKQLEKETDRAILAETKTSEQLQAEILRAMQSEEDLKATLALNRQHIQESILSLQSAIAQEHTERVNDAELVTELIEVESTRAKEVEEELTRSLTRVTNALSVVEADVCLLRNSLSENESTDTLTNDKIAHLSAAIIDVDKKIEESLTQIRSNISEVVTQYSDADVRIQSVLTELKNKDVQTDQHIVDIANKLAQVRNTVDTVVEVSTNNKAALKLESATRANELTAVRNSLLRMESEISNHSTTTNKSFNSVNSSIADIRTTVELIHSAVDELERRMESVPSENNNAELAKVREEIVALKQSINVLTDVVNSETRRATNTELTLQTSQNEQALQLSTLLIELTGLKKSVDNLLTTKEVILTDIQNLQLYSVRLGSEVERISKRYDAVAELVQQHIEAVTKDYNNLTIENNAINTQLLELTSKYTVTLDAMSVLSTDLSKIVTEVSNCKDAIVLISEEHTKSLNNVLNLVEAERLSREARVNELYTYIHTLQTAISEAEASIHVVEAKIESANENTQTIQKSLDFVTASNDAKFADISHTLTDVKQDIRAEQLARSNADASLEQKINNFGAQLDSVIEDATLTAHLLEEIKTVISNLKNTNVATDTDIQQLNNKIQQIIEQYNFVHSSAQAVAQKVTTLQETHTADVQLLNNEYQQLFEQLLALTEDVRTIASQVVELSTVTNSVDALQAEIYNITGPDGAIQQRISDVESHVSSVSSIVTQHVSDVEVALRNTSEDVEKAQESIEGLVTDLAEVKKNTLQLNNSVDEVKNIYSISQDAIKKTQEDVASLTNLVNVNIEQTQDSIEADREQIGQLGNTLYQHTTHLAVHDKNIDDLQAKDIQLQTDIQNTQALLQEHSDLHISHYREVVSKLEHEIKRAIAADASLLTSTNLNSSRIVELHDELLAIIERLVNELKTVDEELDDKIQSDRMLSDEADARLRTTIQSVDSTARERDLELEKQINEIATDYVPLIENDATVVKVYAQNGVDTITIPTDRAALAEAIVRRDSNGNILLNTDEEAFSLHSAVSKLFVETAIAELRDELLASTVSFDFIDGGNAPID